MSGASQRPLVRRRRSHGFGEPRRVRSSRSLLRLSDSPDDVAEKTPPLPGCRDILTCDTDRLLTTPARRRSAANSVIGKLQFGPTLMSRALFVGDREGRPDQRQTARPPQPPGPAREFRTRRVDHLKPQRVYRLSCPVVPGRGSCPPRGRHRSPRRRARAMPRRSKRNSQSLTAGPSSATHLLPKSFAFGDRRFADGSIRSTRNRPRRGRRRERGVRRDLGDGRLSTATVGDASETRTESARRDFRTVLVATPAKLNVLVTSSCRHLRRPHQLRARSFRRTPVGGPPTGSRRGDRFADRSVTLTNPP